MNKTFKILLLVLLAVIVAESITGVVVYYRNIRRAPDTQNAKVFRGSWSYAYSGSSNSPPFSLNVLKKPEGDFSWKLSRNSVGSTGMGGFVTDGCLGKEGFFVLDQKTASLWYADSQQLGRISVEGQNTNWRWGSLCPDGKPISPATAKRVFGFTNVPPAFREEVKRVFPKLILPKETAQ